MSPVVPCSRAGRLVFSPCATQGRVIATGRDGLCSQALRSSPSRACAGDLQISFESSPATPIVNRVIFIAASN